MALRNALRFSLFGWVVFIDISGVVYVPVARNFSLLEALDLSISANVKNRRTSAFSGV